MLHPKLPELYRGKVANLIASLNDVAVRQEAGDLIRSMIDQVVLTPNTTGGLDAALHGDIANIITVCDAGSADTAQTAKDPANASPAGPILSVVAGIGFEPMTSRL